MWSNGLQMERLEVSSVACFALRPQRRHSIRGRGAVLEPSLRENRHIEAEYRADASPDDLTFERVQSLVRPLRQLGKGDRLGDRDHRRPRVRTESIEAVRLRARVAAHASATEPPEYVSECLMESTPHPS